MSDEIVGYRTDRNPLPLGVISSMSRGDRIAAVRSILLLIAVLILPFLCVGTVKADALSPENAAATSTTALERQRALPAWTEGTLYIHHISTGRGNASYFVMPDGTTMLIDAGEADPSFIASVAPLKAFPQRPPQSIRPAIGLQITSATSRQLGGRSDLTMRFSPISTPIISAQLLHPALRPRLGLSAWPALPKSPS